MFSIFRVWLESDSSTLRGAITKMEGRELAVAAGNCGAKPKLKHVFEGSLTFSGVEILLLENG